MPGIRETSPTSHRNLPRGTRVRVFRGQHHVNTCTHVSRGRKLTAKTHGTMAWGLERLFDITVRNV